MLWKAPPHVRKRLLACAALGGSARPGPRLPFALRTGWEAGSLFFRGHRGVNAGISRRREPCRCFRGRRGALPVWLVGAFEKPIRANEADGYLARSVGALAEHARAIEDNYGLKPLAGFVVALKGGDILVPEGPDAPAPLGERVSFTELPGRVLEVVSPRVGREERA